MPEPITTVEQATAAGKAAREKALAAGLDPISGKPLVPSAPVIPGTTPPANKGLPPPPGFEWVIEAGKRSGVVTSDAILADEKKKTSEQLAKDQADDAELARLGRQKTIKDLQTELGGGVTAPAKPGYVKTYEELRTEKGISGLEDQVRAIDDESALLMENLRKFKKAEPAGETAGFALGRISEEAQNVQDRMDFLTRQRNSLTADLNNRNNYISNIMTLTEKDYDTALTEYNTEYDKNYKTQELYNKEATELQKNAQTYLTTVSNLIQAGGANFDSIDDNMKAAIYTKELEAGWMPGTLETFARMKPKANLLATSSGYDAAGNGMISFVYADENGNPGIVQTVGTGTKRPSTGGEAGLTPTQLFDRELKLAGSFETYAKEARSAIRSITIVETGFDEVIKAMKEGKGLNAQSQAVIIGFNKLLDPTSVVRESEYARTPEGQAIVQKMEGKFIQIQQGGAGMTVQGLEEIKNTAVALLRGYKEQLLNYAIRTKNQADSIGADLSRVLTPDVIEFMNKELGGSKEDLTSKLNAATIGSTYVDTTGKTYKKVGDNQWQLIQ